MMMISTISYKYHLVKHKKIEKYFSAIQNKWIFFKKENRDHYCCLGWRQHPSLRAGPIKILKVSVFANFHILIRLGHLLFRIPIIHPLRESAN